MTRTTLNIALLTEVVQWAIDDYQRGADVPEPAPLSEDTVIPIRWEQSNYLIDNLSDIQPGQNWCGTACCIAGYVAMKGWAEDGAPAIIDTNTYLNRNSATHFVERWVGGKAEELGESIVGPHEYAKHVMGLTYVEAEHLFEGGNSIERVIELAMEIAADAGFDLNVDTRGLLG